MHITKHKKNSNCIFPHCFLLPPARLPEVAIKAKENILGSQGSICI